MDYTQTKRWMGFGVKSGGQLLIGGYESTTAWLWNLHDGERFELQVHASRWGMGLGGSGGAVVALGFGFTLPDEIHRSRIEDWGVNVSIAEKLFNKSMFASMRLAVVTLQAAKAIGIAKMSSDMLSNLQAVGSRVFGGLEAQRPKGVILMDVPGAGVGLEAAAYYTKGTMYTAGYTDPDFGD